MYIQPVPRTRIGGSPRTRDPAPNPQPSPAHTHTHTHTPGNKSLIPLSTFHFLYLLPVLLPTTGYKYVLYTQYCSKKIQNTLGPYILPYLTLPTSLDHRSSFYRQYVRNLRNCRAETTYLVASLSVHLHHHHHHQTRIRVRRGVPFPTMYM